jgi:cell division septation protein DedD
MTEACDVMPSRPRSKSGSLALQLRILACISILAWVAACASHNGPRLSASQEAAQYQARARGNYTPPGPPWDPWGPYVVEASQRYDVPVPWIRQVMRVESDGRVMDTSSAGAMGLMQVMPQTYDELRGRYQLGDDAYDPHDNVMAGTAYLREMYDIYGFPGFLAAYNAGPARLDDYLMRNRPLPDETRHYVARIAPAIVGIEPNRPSQAAAYAMNRVPIDIPPGPRYPRHSPRPVALAANQPSRSAPQRTVQTASLAAPSLPVPPPAEFTPAPRGGGFHLISPAMAETLPASRAAGGTVSGSWAIQVGAFGNESQARAAADAAKGQAHELLGHAHPTVGVVHTASATLYRARIGGLSRDAAVQACERIGHGHGRNGCIVLSPAAQS